MDMDRGANGRTERLRSLDLESQQDFVRGFRRWVFADMDAAASKRAETLLQQAGVNAEEDADLDQVRGVLHGDALIGVRNRCWLTSQQSMWSSLIEQFRTHEDHYLGRMERADAAGPGSLELNPGLDIPAYARREVHIQPGGYVGDEFGGALYHYGTNSFYQTFGFEGNDADEVHKAQSLKVAAPADGRVARVLDIGCGVGQMALALKERFPDAEVWGLDVGGPLVRYAHQRAVDLNIPVHFVQRLAEDTRFEDASFDVVAAYIMFHEVSPSATKAVLAEMFRILRPGGVFTVLDFQTGGAKARKNYHRYTSWIDHVYNSETWSRDFVASDFRGLLTNAGFVFEDGGQELAIQTYIARKPG